MLNDLLHKFNINRSTLTNDELQTIDTWAKALRTRKLAPEDVLEYIESMITAIERELTGYDTPQNFTALIFRRNRRKHLEARLFNYLMLRDFLSSPEKARKFAETQLRNLSNQVGKLT